MGDTGEAKKRAGDDAGVRVDFRGLSAVVFCARGACSRVDASFARALKSPVKMGLTLRVRVNV